MDRPWSCFPGQSSSVTIQLQSVGKLLRLFLVPNKLHDGEELLMSIKLLLLLQDQHEVVSVARLHHDPVHGSGKVDVSCQEHDVLPVQGCDGPVNLDQVGHHVLQGSLPFTTGSWTRTRVRTELATVLVLRLLRVKHRGSAPDVVVLAGELDCAGHLLHGKVPDIATQLATAGGTTGQLWPAIGAD